eukprot:4605308-Heterocapsa_arctica.AAC.1
MPEKIDGMEPKKIKLFEYCCADNTLLSSWFLAHRQEAARLLLPHDDMSKMSSARRLLAELRARVQEGRHSVVWIALPCTPWSSWQRYNLRVASKEGFDRLQRARIESIKMLQVSWFVVNSVQKEEMMKKHTHFAFEWP